MRVIAGKYRSRKLRTLRGNELRPTSDRLRETLFNILGAAVSGSVFVDVFAGSGAVGIEALSRGADEVFFIENHRAAAELIKKNLAELGIVVEARILGGPRVEILPTDALAGLEELSRRHIAADFVFADPPYAVNPLYDETLEFLGHPHLLAPDGRVILEHRKGGWSLPQEVGSLELARVVEQGDSALSFYRLARAA